jgi:hypothetical protein
MSPDYIAAWRTYLTEKIQERYEIGSEEAHELVAQWLHTLSLEEVTSR